MDSKELKQLIEDLRSMAQNENMVDPEAGGPELLKRAADALEAFLRALDDFDVNG